MPKQMSKRGKRRQAIDRQNRYYENEVKPRLDANDCHDVVPFDEGLYIIGTGRTGDGRNYITLHTSKGPLIIRMSDNDLFELEKQVVNLADHAADEQLRADYMDSICALSDALH